MTEDVQAGGNAPQPEQDGSQSPRWWAMSATFNRSMQARERLTAMGLECFVPLRTAVTLAGNKKRKRLVPAVSNLIFVRSTEARIQQAKDALGYLQFLCNRELGRARRITVSDEQMAHFMSLAGSADGQVRYLSPTLPELRRGDRVRIHGGPFDGVVGTFVKLKGARRRMVVVTIPTVISVATLSFTPELLQKLPATD